MNSTPIKVGALVVGLLLLTACSEAAPSGAESEELLYDWRDDWAVPAGFSLQRDTEGYHNPTAIAFVPHPGSQPDDPLYFVTELRGTVKVVTNDRSVHVFAEDFFRLLTDQELPAAEAQNGLTGICLDPDHGHVFVTFAYQDEGGALHNNIARFQSVPGTFSLRPTARTDFTDVFSSEETAFAHQIGHCQVADGQLYVGVGDAHQPGLSQQLHSTNGKILRMTLEGAPATDNPFYDSEDPDSVANYVWALGFRNPFGLRIVEGRLFVAENGTILDRFLEVQAGENYLWNGDDWSIGMKADIVFTPSVVPVQVDFYPAGRSILPEEFENSFFVALWGAISKPAGVLSIRRSAPGKDAFAVPEYFVRHRPEGGRMPQSVVGMAVGPDGLYFAPIVTDRESTSAVYRVAYDPAEEHPHLLSQLDAPALIDEKGCIACHKLAYTGGDVGPPLDRAGLIERIRARLDAEGYRESLAELDQLEQEPFPAYKGARAEVLNAEGMEQVRTWMKYRLMEPRFDDPSAQMPSLGLTEREARLITDFLLAEPEPAEASGGLAQTIEKVRAEIDRRVQPLRYRHLLLFFIGGFISSYFTRWAWAKARRRKSLPD